MITKHTKVTILSFYLLTCIASTIFGAKVSKEKNNFRFDFHPDKQSPAPGWQAVNSKTIYTPETGYGWLKEWGYTLKNSQEKKPLCQGAASAPHTVRQADFKVDLPNGIYEVEVLVGSTIPTEGRQGICVATNGQAVLPPPGVGGWGIMARRKLPAVVSNGTLDIKFFISGKGGSHRLNIYALSISKPETADLAKQLKEEWQEALPYTKVNKRKITINNKDYIEIGRRNEKQPGLWLDSYKQDAAILYTRNNPGDIYDYSIPREAEITNTLSTFATPAESTPFYFGVYANHPLTDTRVCATSLKCGNKTIYPESITIYTVTCHPQSPSESPATTVKIAPELLEKKIPFALKQGQTQPMYILVKVPADQPAGIYTGKIIFSPKDRPRFNMQLSLRILPFKLQKPKNKTWHLYNDCSRWAAMSERDIQLEIEDQISHGINSLKLGTAPLYGSYIEKDGNIDNADFGCLGKGMRYAAKQGMNGPLLISSTNALRERLMGWKMSTKGDSTYQVIHKDKKAILTIKNPTQAATFHLSTNSHTLLSANEPVRFEINYRLSGSGRATAHLRFDSLQRQPSKEGMRALNLNPTNKWQRMSITSTVPVTAPNAIMWLNYQGGPGKLEIDSITLLGQDGIINHVNNSDFNIPIIKYDANKTWPASIAETYQKAISAHVKAAKDMGFQDVFIEGTDEAGNNPKSEFQEIAELREAHQTGAKTWCNLSPVLAEKSKDILDGICFYASMFGDEAKGLKLINYFQSLGKKMYFISSGTYEGQDYDLMPNRYGNGFFFWKSGCDGVGIWTFQRSGGDPYDDFDTQYRDHLLVYPPRKAGGEPVPTIAWEGIREGWKDFCYVYTLEQTIAEAQKKNRTDLVDMGNTTIDFIRKRVPWYDLYAPNQFDNKVADNLRWLAAWTTMTIIEKLHSPKTAKVAQTQPVNQALATVTKQPDLEANQEKPLLCPPCSEPPILDGTLTDNVWQKAATIPFFENYVNRGIKAKNKTVVRLTHDHKNLYLGFRCYEPDTKTLKSKKREHDGNVFADDSIEIFIDSDNDQFSYYQLCFNPAGSKFDMKCGGGYNFGENIFKVAYSKKKVRDQQWNGKWQVKTSIKPTFWEAEVVIPFATVGRKSDIWGLHLGRNSRTAGHPASSWRAIGMFNQPDKFGKLVLTGSRLGNTTLTDWQVSPFYAGQNNDSMLFDNLVPCTAFIKTTDENNATKIQPGIASQNKISFPFKLNTSCKQVDFSVTDNNQQRLYQFMIPTIIPPSIILKNPKLIYFSPAAEAIFQLLLNMSDTARKGSKVKFTIARKQHIIVSKTFPLESNSYQITTDIKSLPPGAYQLKFILSSANGSVLAENNQELMIIPNFIQKAN